MKYFFCLLTGMGLLCHQLCAQAVCPEKTVIKGVKIISMDPAQPKVTDNSDVFIINGKIKKITPATSKKDRGYEVVNGNGKYLIPGMADMHVHLPRPSSDIQTREFYLLNLLNGVTTLRQMRGKPSDLLVRDSVNKGLLLGCNTYISTPPFFWISDDYKKNLFTAILCRDSLEKFKKQGYDFVKYVGTLSALQYDTLAMIAASLNLKLTGHAPQNDLAKATEAGQHTIEHIEPYVSLYQKDSVLFWQTIDKMIAKGLFNSPDVLWYVITGSSTPMDKKKSVNGVAYLKKGLADTMEKEYTDNYMAFFKRNPMALAKAIIRDSTQTATYKYLLPRMQKRGLKLLIGGDPDDFILPGYAVANEIELFVTTGISPYEAIKCATSNAADCLGEKEKWGSISENKRADLVLLAANPLDDINNLRKVDATIINGKVLTKEYLTGELKKVHSETNEAALPAIVLSPNDSLRMKKYVDSAFRQPLYAHKRDAYLDSALAILPSYAYLWQQKSNPAVKQRKYELAIQYLDSAVKYDCRKYLDYRGFTKCIFQKDYKEAIKDFDAAYVLNGESGVMDHSYSFFKGLCYLQLNKFDSAEHFITQSIDNKITKQGSNWVHPMEWFYAGIVQFEKERYPAAINYFDSCLKTYANFPEAQYYKSHCLINQKDYKSALALMRSAKTNADQGFSFNEDSAPYEQFPYQVNHKSYPAYIEWLEEQAGEKKK
jgi:imidazolonepropionase-like amidohydrolase